MSKSTHKKRVSLLINTALKENKICVKNLRLLFKSIYYSLISTIKRKRNVSSEIYSYESLFFIKLNDPIRFLESCRKNANALDPKIRNEVYKLKEVFNVNILETLEIGSGPNSNLSYWVDQKLIKVTAIDPLADTYKKIMQKLGYIYPIVPMKLKGEELLNFFDTETFHIVFAQNSLDHAENPILCFTNGYYLLKKGGLYFVCSNIKEGSRTSWTGMHKFDIYFEDNELFLVNQNGQVFNFIDKTIMNLELIFYEEYERIKGVPSFEAVFRKI